MRWVWFLCWLVWGDIESVVGRGVSVSRRVAGARVVKQNKHFLREHKRTRSSIRRGRGKCGKAESDWWGWKIIACRRVLRCSKARDFVWMAVESAGVSVDFGKGGFFGRRRVVVVDKFSGLGGGKVGVGVHRGMWKGVEKPTDSTGLWEGFPGIHRKRIVRKAGCGGIFGGFHKRWDLNVWKTENFPHGFPQGVEKGVLGSGFEVDFVWKSGSFPQGHGNHFKRPRWRRVSTPPCIPPLLGYPCLCFFFF